MNTFTSILSCFAMVAATGCVAMGEPSPTDGALDPALRALGIAELLTTEDGTVLIDAAGAERGRVTVDGPAVEVELDGTRATLLRSGVGVVAACPSQPLQTVPVASSLIAALDVDALSDGCHQAMVAGAVVSGIATARAPGCEEEEVDGALRLACDGDLYSQRLLDFGGGCRCQEDFSGYCAAECWSCSGYDPFGSCGGGGGGGGEDGGGGGVGGGGDGVGGEGGGGDDGGDITCPEPQSFGGYGFGFTEEEARSVAALDAAGRCYESAFGWCAPMLDQIVDQGCTGDDGGVSCWASAACSYQPL